MTVGHPFGIQRAVTLPGVRMQLEEKTLPPQALYFMACAGHSLPPGSGTFPGLTATDIEAQSSSGELSPH